LTRAEFAADLARHGFLGPAEITLAPDERRDPHTHDFAVRGLVTRGELILVREGAAEHFRPGDPFTLDLGCSHYEAAGPEGAAYLVGRRTA
jgi:quercetin dioxygenase-like cupin family protein